MVLLGYRHYFLKLLDSTILRDAKDRNNFLVFWKSECDLSDEQVIFVWA